MGRSKIKIILGDLDAEAAGHERDVNPKLWLLSR
jgi:hypothetical protein